MPTKTPVSTKAATQKSKPGNVIVNGIAITHPDRVISEAGDITKGQLAEYYGRVAPFILPNIVKKAS